MDKDQDQVHTTDQMMILGPGKINVEISQDKDQEELTIRMAEMVQEMTNTDLDQVKEIAVVRDQLVIVDQQDQMMPIDHQVLLDQAIEAEINKQISDQVQGIEVTKS